MSAQRGVPGMSEWQDIKTAPKDGSFILLHCPNGQLESGDVTVGAYWKEDRHSENGRFMLGKWWGWLGMDGDGMSSWCEPTHWMPLPAPPAPLPSMPGRR